MAKGESYEDFLEKFKPKKTTDDCYTPEVIMNAVEDWVAEKYGLDKKNFVRPFWPGGDYENFNYPEGAVVVDNPPFSILSRIIEFYGWKEIKFFLFAPSLTCLPGKSTFKYVCALPIGCTVTYANGAEVNTGFLTNLEPDLVVKSEPELYARLAAAEDENRAAFAKSVPTFDYPMNVTTAAMVQRYTKRGIDFSIRRDEAIPCGALDSQRPTKKSIFGGGGILTGSRAAAERAAAERAAAERAAAERAAAERTNHMTWELSEREKRLIALIDERSLK